MRCQFHTSACRRVDPDASQKPTRSVSGKLGLDNEAVFEGFSLDQRPEPDHGAILAGARLTPVVGAAAAGGGAEDVPEGADMTSPGSLTRAGVSM